MLSFLTDTFSKRSYKNISDSTSSAERTTHLTRISHVCPLHGGFTGGYIPLPRKHYEHYVTRIIYDITLFIARMSNYSFFSFSASIIFFFSIKTPRRFNNNIITPAHIVLFIHFYRFVYPRNYIRTFFLLRVKVFSYIHTYYRSMMSHLIYLSTQYI